MLVPTLAKTLVSAIVLATVVDASALSTQRWRPYSLTQLAALMIALALCWYLRGG